MSETNDPQRVLLACPLLQGLDAAHLEQFAAVAKRRSYRANETIFRQGDDCPGIFIVESGSVRIYCDGTGGQRHVLHLCGPNQSFAEVALFSDFALPASASSIEATSCIVIPADFVKQMIENDHAFCRQMLSSMAHWTRHFTQLLGDLVLRDAAERVQHYLGQLPVDADGNVVLPGSKKDIANHLNLSSETFSRTLRRLTDQGSIAIDPQRRIRVKR